MIDMDRDEPNELDLELERLRENSDKAYDEFVEGIRRALAAGLSPSRIARHTRWTREYIAKIRDGRNPRRP